MKFIDTHEEVKSNMQIVIVDGQGGGIGKSIVRAIKERNPSIFLVGVGTNSVATTNMKKAGADIIATGENAILYNVSNADVIIGPIGIAFANSMYGEISPAIAQAISLSKATKYLIPVSKCSAHVIGTIEKTIPQYIEELLMKLEI